MESSPHGVVGNVLDCDIVVSEFELKSLFCFWFRTNTLGNVVKAFISITSYELNSTNTGVLQVTHEGWYANKQSKSDLLNGFISFSIII